MSQIANYGSGGTPIPPGTFVQTLTGNTGGPITPTVGGDIQITGSGNIITTGTLATHNINITFTGILPIANGGTNNNGSNYNNFGTLYFDGLAYETTTVGTLNQVLTSNGPGVAPTYQNISASGAVTSVNAGSNISITGTATAPIVNVIATLPVSIGGTGNTTFTPFSVITAGTTATGPFQNVVGVGTSGQILVSGGAAALPVWTTLAAGGVTSVTGTANQITSSPTTGAVTLSVPATFIAPGSIAATTTVTAATGLVATAGGITATGNSSINTSGAGTSAIGTGTNTGTIAIGNTSSGLVIIDSGTAGISVGATANAHSSIFGSTNSTSATTVQSGSGALSITATNGALTMISGTGTLAIANDATAQTVNIATGVGAKVTTLGSTNGASSLALKYGTGNFSIASATGTIMSALSGGPITYPLQSAFLAVNNADQTNVTGDSTQYTVTFVNKIFDQHNDFNGVSTFTAPVTGRYAFYVGISVSGLVAANTNDLVWLATTAAQYRFVQANIFPITITGGAYVFSGSFFVNMTAADTATVVVDITGGAKVTSLQGATTLGYRIPYFGGNLVC